MRRASSIMYTVLIVLGVAILAAGAAAIVGARRWDRETRALRARLETERVPVRPAAANPGDLDGLPAPVERFFRAALSDAQPMIAAARLQHEGTFNMAEQGEQWRPFVSDQLVVARRPGFDWSARIAMMPFLPVRVHDAYVGGDGILHAAVLGLVSVADVRGGGDIAQGELMRFLAESTWYPTVLLPGQGVRWEAVDDRSARATLTDGSVSASLVFTFDDAGLIDTVRADARGRMVKGVAVPTPWQGRFWNYEVRGGMRVPIDGEVAWLTPDGPKPYWRGHMTAVAYELAR